ncbi:hypothetical protein [Bradyrhizobium sp. BR 1433]
MITERLSDPQFYGMMASFLGLAICVVVLVVAWPLDEREQDAGLDSWVKR